MWHRKRRWSVAPVASPEDLAEKLTEHTWTLCTAFELQGYLFLNDSTSEGDTGEFAVVKPLSDGGHVQVESITFGWCKPDRALELIREVLAGKFDAEAAFGVVQPALDSPQQHGRCAFCA